MSYIAKDRLVILTTLGAGLAALGIAWTSQYGFDLFPCELCLYQRLPYMGVVVLSLLALMPAVDRPSRRLAVQVCGLLFATTAAIAAYHVGVEQGWWQSSCAPSGAQNFSVDDVFSVLQQPGTPACDEVPFTLFGISMAGYNVIAGLILAALTFGAARKSTIWTDQ